MNGVKGKLGGSVECDKCDDVWGQWGCNVEEITSTRKPS